MLEGHTGEQDAGPTFRSLFAVEAPRGLGMSCILICIRLSKLIRMHTLGLDV